jgi:dephospho-CoA kinase
MLKVGITGGIGSGKSTVAYIFAQLGVPCFFADNEAKLAYLDPEVKSKVLGLFGDNAYVNNLPDKSYISQIIFSDKSFLSNLNQIIHPFVATQFQKFCSKHQQCPYVLKEAAILFESDSYKALDLSILVVADKRLRIQRVMDRDGLSENEVLLRMDKQWSDEKKIKLASFVVYNNNTDLLIPQVLDLHHKILKLTKK